MSVDRQAAESAIVAFLRALGRNEKDEPELAGTGARVTATFIEELCAGYAVDVEALLHANVLHGSTEVVIVRGIPITTTCPHHLMPAVGTGVVAFAPRDLLIGLGTVTKLVDAYARRLTLQEQIGNEVVASLMKCVHPTWAACKLVLSHSCVTARGERPHGTYLETIALAGDLAGDKRGMAFSLVGDPKR